MADPYTIFQDLTRDCDDILSMYENGYHEGGRARMLQGYIDKWDADFGKGFFIKEIKKQFYKQKAREAAIDD